MMLINGVASTTVSATDRGLAFGDGIFRTMAFQDGEARLWRWQYPRLRADAAALGLEVPDAALLQRELALAGAHILRGVAKITLTRGSGPRGYALSAGCSPTRIVSVEPWEGYPPGLARDGIELTLCQLRLAPQPRLAGVKHLNRLENVLARSEWQDPAIREGLLLDSEGAVVECTMSNLFWLRAGEWQTPLLDRCGVAGAMRAWMMDQVPVRQVRAPLESLLAADEVFVCNSLAGIWPVARLGARHWRGFPRATMLSELLARER